MNRILLVIFLALTAPVAFGADPGALRLATTTSTDNSGLLKVILPPLPGQKPPPTPKPAPLEPDRPVSNYGYTHMALDVTDLASIHARLAAAGMDFHTTPLDGYGVSTTYGRDPFGNVIELQEIHDETHVKRVAL